MNRFQLTPRASDDLRDIVAWLEENSPDAYAPTAEEAFFEKFQLLADFPGLGHRRPT